MVGRGRSPREDDCGRERQEQGGQPMTLWGRAVEGETIPVTVEWSSDLGGMISVSPVGGSTSAYSNAPPPSSVPLGVIILERGNSPFKILENWNFKLGSTKNQGSFLLRPDHISTQGAS
ncbi:unnamed protein product, partial [Nesidiocoris tenuis]